MQRDLPTTLLRTTALRCQAMIVSGFAITRAERHSVHTRESQIQSRRSELFNRSRFFASR